MSKTNSKNKNESFCHSEEKLNKAMFLEQVIYIKTVLGWGAAILVTLMPISYGLGRWMQRIDDKFEIHQKQVELNEARTQLTVEFIEKITNLERENSRLETLLEVYKGKEEENGK